MTDPAPTRREGGVDTPPATRREDQPHLPPATRREGGDGSYLPISPDTLPPALAARLDGFTAMPTTGAEAQLVQVRDTAFPGAPRVLKIYYPGIEPDGRVWSELTEVQSSYVVDVHETGRLSDGRFYELMEFLPGGSMRELGAGRAVFRPAQVVKIVSQLADALTALHARRITHRDLKPENVLVRSTEPLSLAVTDFGLSRRLDASYRYTSVALTSAYAAPETWAGMATPAVDWWSLGIIALELATGHRAFEGLDDRVIHVAVTTKPVPVDAIEDPRLQRLCAGLLVADPATRWSQDEVADWLAGGSPPVPDRRVTVDVTPFEFDGQSYTRLDALAAAMVTDRASWRAAARRFGVSPSVTWAKLVHWLGQLPDIDERLSMELDRLPESTQPADVKLLRLLALLNPTLATTLPPVYRGRLIDGPNLVALARTAQDDPAGEDGEIVVEIFQQTVLSILAGFGGADQLAAIGERWRRAVADLGEAEHALAARRPELGDIGVPYAGPGTDGRSLGELLWNQDGFSVVRLAAMLEVAAGDGAVADDWAAATERGARQLPVPLGWYADLVAHTGTNPAQRFLTWRLSGLAAAQADAVVRARQAAEQARLAREQQWSAHEQGRLAGRGSAQGRAGGALTLLALIWFVAAVPAYAAEQPRYSYSYQYGSVVTPGAPGAVVAVVVLVLIVHAITELSLAGTLAGDYHPRYSLSQALGRSAGGIGRWMGAHRILTLLLIGFMIFLVSQGAATLTLLAVVVGITHVVSAVNRHNRWRQQHQIDRDRVLNA